jgi:hypothetical protein
MFFDKTFAPEEAATALPPVPPRMDFDDFVGAMQKDQILAEVLMRESHRKIFALFQIGEATFLHMRAGHDREPFTMHSKPSSAVISDRIRAAVQVEVTKYLDSC